MASSNSILGRINSFIRSRSGEGVIAVNATQELERRSQLDMQNIPMALQQLLFKYNTSGNIVNVQQALSIVTFFACIRRLATDLSTLPLCIVRKDTKSIRPVYTYVSDHPAHMLVNSIPNEFETAAEMWEFALASAFFRSRGYIHIVRNNSATPISLRYIPTHFVTEYQDVYNKAIKYTVHGVDGDVPVDDMICIKNFFGVDPVIQFNSLLGLSISAEDYARTYFGNGGSTEGYISSPQGLNDQQATSIKKNWKTNKQNGDTPMLEFGLKYEVVNGRPVDSEMNATRTSTDQQICRIFGMPPQLVGIETTSKYDSVEALSTYYIKFVLRPLSTKITQVCNSKLLRYNERANHYFEHDLDAIHAALSESRWKNYETGLKIGVLSINDVRGEEGYNAVEGGEQHFVQVNQISLDKMADYSDKISQMGPDTGAAANNQNK
jgi:HK97 family phage portal protein